jgi:hypothetical protein
MQPSRWCGRRVCFVRTGLVRPEEGLLNPVQAILSVHERDGPPVVMKVMALATPAQSLPRTCRRAGARQPQRAGFPLSREWHDSRLRSGAMILRLTTVHGDARSALECGGLTPPCSFEIHTAQRAKQGRSASQEPSMNLGRKAASSRRTPRYLRHSHFRGSEGFLDVRQ